MLDLALTDVFFCIFSSFTRVNLLVCWFFCGTEVEKMVYRKKTYNGTERMNHIVHEACD